MVSFRPTESPQMPFEVWSINEKFGQNFDHFQKIQLILRVKRLINLV